MVTLVSIYWIAKVLTALIGLFFGGRKVYKLLRRKFGKKKPPFKG